MVRFDCAEKPWWAPEIEAALAMMSLLVFSAVTAAVLFETVPAANEKYAMLLLGALIGVVKDTFARYFSVTKGGQDQRQTIADMARATADTAAVAVASTGTGGSTVAGGVS